MLQFKEYIINRKRKTNIIDEDALRKKGDYIIKSGKPLIFKKKKIKKVSDLFDKGNFDKKEEEDFSLENEDLSEKFFEKYFQFKLDPEKPKNKIPQSSQPINKINISTNIALTQSNKGKTTKDENPITLFQEQKKNERNNKNHDLEDKNNFTQSIYEKVLNEERLERLKKKKQFRNYISTVYITQRYSGQTGQPRFLIIFVEKSVNFLLCPVIMRRAVNFQSGFFPCQPDYIMPSYKR